MFTAFIVILILTALAIAGAVIFKDKISDGSASGGASRAERALTDRFAPELDAIEFERRAASGTETLVVIFYTTWCPSCTRQMPFFVEVARLFDQSSNDSVSGKDKVSFFRMDTDRVKSISRRLQLRKIPAIHVFKGSSSEPLASSTGIMAPGKLKAMIDETLDQSRQ